MKITILLLICLALPFGVQGGERYTNIVSNEVHPTGDWTFWQTSDSMLSDSITLRQYRVIKEWCDTAWVDTVYVVPSLRGCKETYIHYGDLFGYRFVGEDFPFFIYEKIRVKCCRDTLWVDKIPVYMTPEEQEEWNRFEQLRGAGLLWIEDERYGGWQEWRRP